MSYPPPPGQGNRSYPQPPPPPGSSAPKGSPGGGGGGSGGNKALVVAVVFLGFAVLVAAAVVFVVSGRTADDGSGAQADGSGSSQDGVQEAGGDAAGSDTGEDEGGSGEAEGSVEEPQEDTVVFGPDEELDIEVGSPYTYVDLDTDPPLVTDSRIDGRDFALRPNVDGVALERSTGGIAPLPEGGEEPDRAACLDDIDTNEVTSAEFTTGARFCLQTGEGRVAFVEAVSSPGGTGTATVRMTVWE